MDNHRDKMRMDEYDVLCEKIDYPYDLTGEKRKIVY